jgi:dUTPase
MVFAEYSKVDFIRVENLDDSKRTGGFGSTGEK